MRRLPMPKASGMPTARAASASMWMSMNSSLTAAYRFQLAKPVVRTYGGSTDMTQTLDCGAMAESLKQHVIADSDLHVMEPPDLWQRYIDPAFAHAAPIGLTEIRRDMRVRVKNHTMLRLGTVRPQRAGEQRGGWREDHDSVYADPESRGWDAASQIDAMDAEGLDLAVLYPSRGLFVLGLDSVESIGSDGLEPEYASAIARAYNDWLAEFCSHSPARM